MIGKIKRKEKTVKYAIKNKTFYLRLYMENVFHVLRTHLKSDRRQMVQTRARVDASK